MDILDCFLVFFKAIFIRLPFVRTQVIQPAVCCKSIHVLNLFLLCLRFDPVSPFGDSKWFWSLCLKTETKKCLSLALPQILEFSISKYRLLLARVLVEHRVPYSWQPLATFSLGSMVSWPVTHFSLFRNRS